MGENALIPFQSQPIQLSLLMSSRISSVIARSRSIPMRSTSDVERSKGTRGRGNGAIGSVLQRTGETWMHGTNQKSPVYRVRLPIHKGEYPRHGATTSTGTNGRCWSGIPSVWSPRCTSSGWSGTSTRKCRRPTLSSI